MTQREWKIGDWLELRRQRFLVYRVEEQTKTFWAIPKTGGQQEIFCDFDDCDVKRLDGCDSWDWQPPKPIEPPQGYRLLGADSEDIVKPDFLQMGSMREWNHASHFVGETVRGAMQRNEYILAFARKIEPKVRPMTRAEFLEAWKQRGFCPLIDTEQDIDVVFQIIEEDEFDNEIINTSKNGWCSLDLMTGWKFLFDETYLTVEE